MVVAAGRAYARAARTVRAARPRVARAAFARRALGGAFVAGIVVLGLIAFVSPASFGQPGASPARSGWPPAVLLALIAAGIAIAVARRAHMAWLVQRIRDPWVRPLEEVPGFVDAVEDLERCPAPLRTRFALAWVWGPAALAVTGGTFAFSAAYFVVDAVLARGRVGWGQPAYALAFAVLSWLVFALAAGRLATFRFAASVLKEATTGYPG